MGRQRLTAHFLFHSAQSEPSSGLLGSLGYVGAMSYNGSITIWEFDQMSSSVTNITLGRMYKNGKILEEGVTQEYWADQVVQVASKEYNQKTLGEFKSKPTHNDKVNYLGKEMLGGAYDCLF